MPRRYYSNTAQPTTLTSEAATGDTTINVPSTAGYPTAPFTIALSRGTVNEEVVLVGGKTSTTFTSCTRAYDGTTAATHPISSTAEHTVVAIDYETASAHVYDTARDDHTQYLTEVRHDALPHGASTLGAGAVETAKIADDAVTSDKIASGAVLEDGLGAGSVVEAKIGTGAVTTTKLGDGSVTNVKLGADSVTATKIADGAIQSEHFAVGALSAASMGASVAGLGLGINGGNGSLEVNVDGSTVEISGDTVQVKDGGIVAAKLGTGSVTNTKLGAGSVNKDKAGAGVYRNMTGNNSGGGIRYSLSGPSGTGYTDGDIWLRYS